MSCLKTIHTMDDVTELVEGVGFLPMFNNAMPDHGFSVEVRGDAEKWFTDGDGPWEWKGPLI